jgi:hypothetical protein
MMESANHFSTIDHRWHVYKRLELLPDPVLDARDRKAFLTFGFDWVWRQFIRLLVNELDEEQHVEYLYRCWELDEFGKGSRFPAGTLQRLWILMR